MLLQILSDVHLEFRDDMPAVEKHADHLALLGDVGDPFTEAYAAFIGERAAQFESVLVIAGNHEFYSRRSVQDVIEQIRNVCDDFSNVHFLERSCHRLSSRTIVAGCTLWSPISACAARGMNDFRHIPGLTRAVYRQWHERDVEWLRRTLREIGDEGCDAIVLTHHGAHPRMGGVYEGNEASSGFVCDLSDLFREPVIAFASGHVHSNVDMTLNGVRSVSNALGYEEEDTGHVQNTTIAFH